MLVMSGGEGYIDFRVGKSTSATLPFLASLSNHIIGENFWKFFFSCPKLKMASDFTHILALNNNYRCVRGLVSEIGMVW
jgi:hypothetical protein